MFGETFTPTFHTQGKKVDCAIIAASSLYTGGGHQRSDYHTSVSFKRRRLSFSQHMPETQKSNELREGKTCMRGVTVDSEVILKEDIVTIPALIEAQDSKSVRDCHSDYKMLRH